MSSLFSSLFVWLLVFQNTILLFKPSIALAFLRLTENGFENTQRMQATKRVKEWHMETVEDQVYWKIRNDNEHTRLY